MTDEQRHSLRARVRALRVPPVQDALAVGRSAPIPSDTLQRALELFGVAPLIHLEFEDEVVSGVLVRPAILRRLPAERLRAFVLDRIKPLMDPSEILQLELSAEVVLEGSL